MPDTPFSAGQAQAQAQTQSGGDPPLIYSVPPDLLDDAFTPGGSLKPQWEYLLNGVQTLGPGVMREREQKARRILRDDGATYNMYGGDGTPSQSWELDPLPFIIGSDDWADIEAGLIERAELFNLLLRDIYGPRSLLRHGVLPPEALFSTSGFLRACQGITVPGEHELILHAADMIRQRDGSMCVLSDRTQTPSGAGYVLENRTVMSRVFPSLYRDSHVHRISSFYHRLRTKLTSLSPTGDPTRIALLTAGGRNEHYFEHAYLANYMGLLLVQSGDLVVRDGLVWMKSLDGLTRVDVILRRVDDVLCDPVELRSDSVLGVPGLLEVVRNNRVVIANPLGSGVLENAILLKYLPEISKALIGREPRLDSVQTYWCGDDEDMAHIKTNIRELIIKPAYRGSGIGSVWGGDLSEDELAQLLATLTENRYQYVAQPRLEKSHTPAFTGERLEPRLTLLRTFSVASESSYAVLPGGLTRISTEAGGRVVSMQSGSPSKDTWITASEPERGLEMDKAFETPSETPFTPVVSLPSRVVENLYWMGRYGERAEASLRMLRTAFVILNGEEPISDKARKILLEAVTRCTSTQPGFLGASDELLSKPDKELLLIIKDGNRLGSVRSTLNSMLISADESKELLSTDTMRVINDLRDALENLDRDLASGLASAPEEALDPLVTALVAQAGLMQESMVRGVGWRFMELGKRLERALQAITSINALMTQVCNEADGATLLHAMLTSMEVLITYRRRNRKQGGIRLGLELVMLDASNPRSLLFQLERLQEHLDELPGTEGVRGELEEEQRALLEALTSLKLSRLSQLLQGRDGLREDMQNRLSQLEDLLQEFSRFISDKHFAHRSDPQQLVTTFRDEQ